MRWYRGLADAGTAVLLDDPLGIRIIGRSSEMCGGWMIVGRLCEDGMDGRGASEREANEKRSDELQLAEEV